MSSKCIITDVLARQGTKLHFFFSFSLFEISCFVVVKAECWDEWLLSKSSSILEIAVMFVIGGRVLLVLGYGESFLNNLCLSSVSLPNSMAHRQYIA
jgi:hypothetical protein